jgi:dipeptidyl aminopeptidase/acylaminoacyl peptidase
MRRTLTAWLGVPLGVAIGLLGVRLALGPRLVVRTPAPGALAPIRSELRLTFNQPMEPSSVSTRLRLSPSVDGELQWEGRTLIFRPRQGWPPGATIEVRLEAGARSLSGLAIGFASSWSFSLRAPRLAYLWPAGEPADIYTLLPSAEAPERLTTAGGVEDFAPGAGGTELAYSIVGSDGRTELHTVRVDSGADRLLFHCPEGEHCSSAAISPDGSLLAFVRGPVGQGDGSFVAPGRTRIWVLETESGLMRPVSAEESTSLSPFWSPQGWLTYVDATQAALIVVSLANPQAVEPLGMVPSSLGERGAWSPDGSYLVYPDLLFPSEEEAQGEGATHLEAHLYRWEPATGELLDLSLALGERVEDGAPSFSPDGEWIVFGRRVIAAGQWTPGRQLWRMRVDGTQAEALSDESFINHGAPAWSPAGDHLAYLRFDVEAPLEPAELWWFDLGRRESSQAVVGGYAPAWIP